MKNPEPMAPAEGRATPADVCAYALRLGDDALILAQRLTGWSSRAPSLEEDIALANIGLDLLGQARLLLSYAGTTEGAGRDEDALAFLRSEAEFANCALVELPNGDFAHTMARQLYFSTYQLALYPRLSASTDETLAAVAAKAAKEVAYHRDHATGWVVRLGDGTDESHRRMQAAVDGMWPYTAELFEPDELTDRLSAAGVAIDPAGLRPEWDDHVGRVLAEATLARPAGGPAPAPAPALPGGRWGRHTEHLGPLLAEMQELHRAHPGARW